MANAPQSDARDIKSLGLDGLRQALEEMGQPGYRATQVVRWLYGRGVGSFAEMTDLSRELRERLAARFVLTPPTVLERQVATDGTRKYLLALGSGTSVETVGLPTPDRLTVCFSTQAGCAMRCSFCATGKSGLTRDLGPGEMVDQVMLVAKDFGQRVTNVVAMGQGEPFANYDATMAALRFLNSPDGLNIGARHIAVSTCGLIPSIRRFADEPEQFTLAVSLHSAVQGTRDELMPGVRGMTLPRLREALIEYAEKTGRRPSLEYALIAGVNDTDEQITSLLEFARGMLVHVNLIPVNPVGDSGFDRPRQGRADEIASRLSRAGIATTVRAERGSDIDAACGQLRQRHADAGAQDQPEPA